MEAMTNLDQQDRILPEEADAHINYDGFSDDPFCADNPLFFTTPHLEKLSRLFNYLARFSRKLVVVTGDQGAGKTTLLEHFVNNQNEQDLICYFTALSSDTSKQVLHEISGQLGIDGIGGELTIQELIAEIQYFSLARLDDGRNCIVVIDDAHLFDRAVLEHLYQLTLEDPQQRCAVRLLLCGETRLLEQLSEVVPAELTDKTLFHQQISPLSYDETRQYLQVHFRENTMHDKPPFSEADYLHIYQQSAGLPGRINETTKQVMTEAANRSVISDPSDKKTRGFTVTLVSTLAILAAVFWWLNVQQEDDNPDDSSLTGQVERVDADTQENQLNAERIFADAESQTEKAQRGEEDASPVETNQSDERPDVAAVSQAANVSENSDSQVLAAPSEQADDALESLAPSAVELSTPGSTGEKDHAEASVVVSENKVADQADSREMPREIKATPSRDVKGTLLDQHTRQILAMDVSAYTLQVLGSPNEKNIVAVMSKLAGDKNLLYFEKTHQGAPWYVLIYGQYPTRAAATSAGTKLPGALGAVKPWVREISAVQKELNVQGN